MDRFRETQTHLAQVSIKELARFVGDHVDEAASCVEVVDVETWHSSMQTALHASVKYGKAIRSIQGREARCYHACDYKDFDALCLSIEALAAYRKDYDAAGVEDKRAFWSFVTTINHAVQQSFGEEAVCAPSREQIQQDIDARKATRGASELPSATNAFKMTVHSHFEAKGCAVPSSLEAQSEEEWQAVCDRYVKAMSTPHDKSTFEELCKARDPLVFQQEWPVLDEVRQLWKDDVPVPDECWKCMGQMNSFAQVHGNIPTNMMKNIEDYAQKIALDITSGKMSLDSMNLDRMGQDVLSQCSTEDMEKLANNMSALLPSIADLQRSIVRPP